MTGELEGWAVPLLLLAFVCTCVASAVAHVGTGIAFDAEGRLYFCDTANDVVWRIEHDGRLTVVATGVHTNHLVIRSDGTIEYPEGGYEDDSTFVVVGVDGSGFRVDRNRILRRRPDRVIEVLAGGDDRGLVDGVGSVARFNRPVGLAVDSSGNVFVTDYGNRRVRRVGPSGEVSTIARTSFPWFPVGVAARNGTLFVVERSGNYWGPSALLTRLPGYGRVVGHFRVREIDAGGESRVIAGDATVRAWLVAVGVVIAVTGLGVCLIGRRVKRPA